MSRRVAHALYPLQSGRGLIQKIARLDLGYAGFHHKGKGQ